jgi:transposase
MDTTDARRRRRSWTDALKREIVAASFEPGASASVVARRYDVNTNQLFIWRRQYRDGLLVPTGASGPALLPVTITSEPVAQKAAAPPDVPPPALPRPGRIEIELPGGYRVRVDATIDGKALRRVLDVLERR